MRIRACPAVWEKRYEWDLATNRVQHFGNKRLQRSGSNSAEWGGRLLGEKEGHIWTGTFWPHRQRLQAACNVPKY